MLSFREFWGSRETLFWSFMPIFQFIRRGFTKLITTTWRHFLLEVAYACLMKFNCDQKLITKRFLFTKVITLDTFREPWLVHFSIAESEIQYFQLVSSASSRSSTHTHTHRQHTFFSRQNGLKIHLKLHRLFSFKMWMTISSRNIFHDLLEHTMWT